MDSLTRDLKFGWRSLTKTLGFSLIVVLTLGLGIGANTAIFSIINAIFLQPLPYQEPQRLVMFWESFPGLPIDYVPLNEGGLYDWRERQDFFTAMSGFRLRTHGNGRPMTLTGDWLPRRINGVMSSANLFETLGVDLLRGSGFESGDDLPGGRSVVVISHALWIDLFGQSEDVLNQSIHLDGIQRQIVGVLPPGFYFPPPIQFAGLLHQGTGDVFIPYQFDRDSRGLRTIRVICRLQEDFSLERARAAAVPITRELLELFPESNPDGLQAVLLPVRDQAVGDSRGRLVLLAGAVALILLIACLNVANLLLARASSRHREIAVRAALGAGQMGIVRLLLTESFLLAAGGGLAGIVLAYVTLPLLLQLSSNYVPQLGGVTLSTSVFLFALAATLVTGFLIGLIPAFRIARLDLSQSLKEGGTRGGSGGVQRGRLRKILVVAEVASAIMLLIGAGLLVRSLWQIQRVELGFHPDNVLTLQTWLPDSKYETAESVVGFFDRLMGQVSSLPGVERVGAVNLLPFSQGVSGGAFEIEGRPPVNKAANTGQIADYRIVTGDYFESVGVGLVSGRFFSSADRADTTPVVIIERTLAERLWPDGGWRDGRIKRSKNDPWKSIVGVVETIRDQNLRFETQGIIYLPLTQLTAQSMAVVARTQVPPTTLSGAFRDALRRLDQNLPVEVRSMSSFVVEAQSSLRSPSILLAMLAGLAVILAVTGLYGVISFLTGRRSREIGIRLALGAERGAIFRMVGKEASLLVLAGISLGLLGALAFSRLLASFLYSVEPVDPISYLAATAIFFLIAGIALYVPLRSASRLNPVDALRTE